MKCFVKILNALSMHRRLELTSLGGENSETFSRGSNGTMWRGRRGNKRRRRRKRRRLVSSRKERGPRIPTRRRKGMPRGRGEEKKNRFSKFIPVRRRTVNVCARIHARAGTYTRKNGLVDEVFCI